MLMTLLALLAPQAAAQVEVTEFTLDNGMQFLLVPRHEQPNQVAAGWLAHVGAVNERPGITGISHFFEHMMFKGTTTIGTNDPEKDAWFRAEQERAHGELRGMVLEVQYPRFRAGEIDDPWDPAHDTPEIAAKRAELNTLIEDHRSVIVKDEFDQVYTAAGASGMNAFTSDDVTFYFIGLPANKLELWAWMESDRLGDSVFREFYAERDVVHEERRLRVESTPTGVYDEQVEAAFWTSSPYSWPVIGWPSDLNSYTMEQAREYYATYYAPNNLTGVLAGDFEVEEVKPLLEQYFGHLKRGPDAPPVITTEVPQLAQKRMDVECDCPDALSVTAQGVPYGHDDGFVLETISSLMNGRTGRLYKALVEEQELATSARMRVDSRKYAGAVSVSLTARDGVDPSQLEAAWHAELERLRTEPVPEDELQKVKNQAAADVFRGLRSNFGLMVQVGYSERLGGWEWLNEEPKRIAAVTAEDIQRVAQEIFVDNHRAVAHYRRSADSKPIDPEILAALGDLPPQVMNMMKQQIKEILAVTDAEELKTAMGEMKAQAQTVPAPFKPAFDTLMKVAADHLATLEGGN